jgi:hypothetical protein
MAATCSSGKWRGVRYPRPMRMTTVAAVLVGVMAAPACGGAAESACKLGQDKLDDCKVQTPTHPDARGALVAFLATADDCTAQNDCVAECVIPAPCGAITFVAAGGGNDPNTAIPAGAETFQRCLYACLDGG